MTVHVLNLKLKLSYQLYMSRSTDEIPIYFDILTVFICFNHTTRIVQILTQPGVFLQTNTCIYIDIHLNESTYVPK